MNYFFKKSCLLTVFFSCACYISYAQNPVELSEVVIAAPKFQEKLTRTGKVVTIIDSAQIAQSRGKSIVELLQTQAGIQSVGARSAWGVNQELYVRGSNTGQVLVLMDGFPLNDPSHISQVFDWNLLDLSQLQRIEILKGGQSTLYGSDAMAGVINIVTNKNTTKNREAFASLSGGSFGYFAPTFSFQKNFKKNVITLTGSWVQAKGFSAADVPNGEADGFHREQFRLAWTSYLSDKGELNTQVKGSQYAANLDAGPYTDDLDYTSKAHAFSVNGQLKYAGNSSDFYARFFSDFSSRRFVDDSTYVPQNAYTSYYFANYAGLSQGLEVYGKSWLPQGIQVVYGAEYRWQNASQSDYYDGFGYGYSSPEIKSELAKQSILAGFLTLQKDWHHLGLEVGGRVNRQSTFGTFSTYSLNPYWNITEKWKVFGNLYAGFKVPSLYQLFSAYGNENLMPEKSKTTEIGIQFKNKTDFLRMVWFDHRVRNGIGFQSKNEPPYGQYYNIASQNSQGLEVEGNTMLGKVKISGNYTYLHGSTELQENGKWTVKDYLVRRPSQQFSLQISAPLAHKLSGNVTYQYVGQRIDLVYDDATFATVQKDLSAYHWLDVSLNYQINKAISLNGMLKNVLNQSIVELYGYQGMPVVGMVGIIVSQ